MSTIKKYRISYVASGTIREVHAISMFQVIKAHFPDADGGLFDEPNGMGEVWDDKRRPRAYIHELRGAKR